MLNEIKYPNNRFYNNGSALKPFHFFLDSLYNSNKLDLLLGYFTTSAINILSYGFAAFLQRGGNMRIVLNEFVLPDDIEAITQAEKIELTQNYIDLNNIQNLQKTLSKPSKHFFECLAWLIANDRIQFQFIRLKTGNGISHYKDGIFSDGTNRVGFSGSCNFTGSGLLKNLERLQVFLDWEDNKSKSQIDSIQSDFDTFFNQESNIVEYLDANKIKQNIQDNFGNKELSDLIDDEKEILTILQSNDDYKKVIIESIAKLDKIANSPRFPYSEGPRPYQITAYQNWVKNNYQGFFAMATGTGKTITSLNCLLNEYKKTGIYRAIIIVPTTSLVEQWKKECSKFNFKNIIMVSSKENWDNNLAFFNTAAKLINTSYIVIVTYASLPRPNFQSYFTQLPKDTILIADETHNLGSQGLLKLLPNIHLKKRIGLSATPLRKFDEVGNQAIREFFNDEPPYIVSYSMEEALNIGWLCKYTYHPHIVRLTDLEMEKYRTLSLQLLRMGLFDNETGSFRSTPEIEKKLLERKRIIHKASNKLEVFKSILKSEFDKRKNLKFTLIYVPEGVEANFGETDFSVETEDDNSLINEYTKAVSQTDDSVMVKMFTANSSNRDEILKNFEQSKIHVLTSMKCLDEGVDVPRSELAIFCSSTGNPRQFIQRRGRVLRLHKDKIYATIHDLVVVPEIAERSTFEMERGLVKKELERVVDFANLAMNKTETYDTLKNILDYYNINLNDL